MEPVVYEIIFAGKALSGFDTNVVKNNMARLFRADDKKLAALFSGRSVTLKKTDDKAVAVKFLQTLQKAGADVKARRARTPTKTALKPSAAAGAPRPAVQQGAVSQPASAATLAQPATKTQPVASSQFDFQHQISAPSFELCALEKTTKANFFVTPTSEAEAQTNISAPNFPLAPVGSPVLERPLPAPVPVQVDTSHMALGQMDNLPLAPPQPQPAPVAAPELEVSTANMGSFADQVPAQHYSGPVPATDQLSMALPGSDIIEQEFKKMPVVIATGLGESLQLMN